MWLGKCELAPQPAPDPDHCFNLTCYAWSLRETEFWFCVVALVVPAALVDLLENAFLFAGEPVNDIAALTALKFTLLYVSACAAAVLLLVGPVWRVSDSGDNGLAKGKKSTNDARLAVGTTLAGMRES